MPVRSGIVSNRVRSRASVKWVRLGHRVLIPGFPVSTAERTNCCTLELETCQSGLIASSK